MQDHLAEESAGGASHDAKDQKVDPTRRTIRAGTMLRATEPTASAIKSQEAISMACPL